MANRIFEIVNSIGLRASLLVHCENNLHYFSDDQVHKPLEERLLAKFSTGMLEYRDRIGRFYPFNGRLIAGHDHFFTN